MTGANAKRPVQIVVLATLIFSATASLTRAEPPQPSAPQPTLPATAGAGTDKPGSPTVDQIVHRDQPPLIVRKRAASFHPPLRHRRVVQTHRLRRLDRPALAGVELVAPLPPPGEPPHFVVPLPAYPLETIATVLTTPLPQIVCHPVRRDPDAPDPRLYREVPVACEPDNP